MKKLSEKGIVNVVSLLVILAIAGVVIWFFLNEGKIAPSGTTVSIPPSQLMPFVPAKEARITICKAKKEELFAQACQSKFDVVGKEDIEKIVELFSLIEEVKNDKNISDYERLLLSQAVFAALPIGDNPENPKSFNIKQSLLSRLKDYLTSQITTYAKEQGISEEEFKDLMKKDLQNMVDSLPKGDNAWVINIMVSKYSWKDGKSQPLYSHQYMESFDPFPNNPNVNTKDINYNVQSAVGSKASSQTVDSDMVGYSFTIMSWKSQEYSRADGLPVEDKFMVQRRNRSDSFYQGEYYLNDLLEAVKMPSTKLPESEPAAKSEPTIKSEPATGLKSNGQTGELEKISCEEYKGWVKNGRSEKCPAWIIPYDEPFIWCAESFGEDDAGSYILKHPPKYAYDFDFTECTESTK